MTSLIRNLLWVALLIAGLVAMHYYKEKEIAAIEAAHEKEMAELKGSAIIQLESCGQAAETYRVLATRLALATENLDKIDGVIVHQSGAITVTDPDTGMSYALDSSTPNQRLSDYHPRRRDPNSVAYGLGFTDAPPERWRWWEDAARMRGDTGNVGSAE